MKFVRTAAFHEDFQSLPEPVQARVKEKFRLFRDNPHHPSLRIKKMQGDQGRRGIWEGHISKKVVFTFRIETDSVTQNETYIFLRIGTHKIYDLT